MSQRTVTRRYATALYQEADATGVLEALDEDVLMLRRSIESNRELSRFFESPVIPKEKKDTIIQKLLGETVEDLLVNFLRLLVEKDRETLTKDVLDQYQSLRDEHRGIVDATVTVAHPLADDDREALVEALEEKTGKDVRLHLEENPDLIGGLVIQIGDRVFDGSVRSQLNELRDRFRNTTLSIEANGEAG
ncbi:MAG: F0F1 ATP synthase subunit delta [Salinibacter sp.]